MQKYDELLAAMDRRFQALRAAYPEEITCGDGCAACCRGLFDVSLPDARRVARGYAALPPAARAAVAERASRLQGGILSRLPELAPPYLLASSDQSVQEQLDALTEAMPEARCPFLDEADHCLIYEDRPLACRLEGLPMVDVRDGLFDDWCERNFQSFYDGARLSGAHYEGLRLDYYAMQEIERAATLRLAERFFAARNACRDDLTMLIPSVVAASDDFHLAIP